MLLCVYITTYQGTQSTTRDEQKSFPRWVCGTILCLKLEAYGTVLLFRAFLCEKGGGGGRGLDKLNKYLFSVDYFELRTISKM